VPGIDCRGRTDKEIAESAESIGYPLLIKASAGGGGRGMRLVASPGELIPNIQSARREAQSFFANPDILLEKLILKPRHIEIQLIADKQGNVVHLFERDCTLQRRFQKVIEIAPAPGLSRKQLQGMYKDAVRITKACGLIGAATAEFLWGAGGEYYFLEVNPRIQVEHPVTEFVCGLDLVELQIRVASGEELALEQKKIKPIGVAIEARIYAEIPEKEYLPGVGTISHLSLPDLSEAFLFKDGVRYDFAIEKETVISTQYDPLLAKVICTGKDHATAVNSLCQTLSKTTLAGTGNNIGFLLQLADKLKQQSPELIEVQASCNQDKVKALALPALLSGLALQYLQKMRDPFFKTPFWRGSERAHSQAKESLRSYLVTCPNLTENIQIKANILKACESSSTISIQTECGTEKITFSQTGDTLLYQGEELRVGPWWSTSLSDSKATNSICLEGYVFSLSQQSSASETSTIAETLDGHLRSPLPGTVIQILCQDQQQISAGDVLVILESMKIEHHIRATTDATVEKIHVSPKNTVKAGQLLVTMKVRDSPELEKQR
jgi:3-methylcrotonyl-CoA carboxylase alpha subunit